MDNESLKQLSRYHPKHREPSSKVEFFGFIKDKNYQDPDPVNHQNWRNEAEMKEAGYADELKILEKFKDSRNEWFVKEEKKKKSRKSTPKVQQEEGSSSQPKKRRKKTVETLLVDEPDEEEPEAEAEAETELLKDLNVFNAAKEKEAGVEEGDDGDKSSSSSSDEEIDETERAKRIEAEIAKEKQLKRKRRQEKDDDVYVPSPKHVSESQTPPSGGRKKTSARKSIASPRQPTPPPEPSPPKSPHPSPPKSPHQSPPRQPSPIQSPPHFTPPHQTTFQEQPILTSQQIFQTPPTSQPRVQSTPGSSGYKMFPNIPPECISLEEIGDFNFASDVQVKNVEKKVDAVLVENKILADREKILEMRVKKVESENKSLLKKIEADQTEIDIMKMKIAELEEEKARRDEQNKYFELKNKELEAAKAMKEHEIYMMNKVLENMLGESIEQRFEEIEVEELRAKRQAEIDAEMNFKGKGVEGSEVTERSIVPSTVSESPIQNPRPISVVFAIFEEDVLLEDGDIGVNVTEASNEQNVDDYMHDDAHEEHESAEGEGEHVDDQNVDKVEKLILRLEPEVEEGEFRHVYTVNDIKEMTRIADPDFKFDFEEELNAFDINQQPDYVYKYVDEADNYDRVEVEDCSDEEGVSEDTSNFPTLVEFFSEENRDELRRKVAEILKDKNFDGTTKDLEKEERKKWFRKDTERKFKRPLKFYKRDRDVSLEELSKVRTLVYPIRKNDLPMWGLIKYESLKNFKHWKPHYPKKVQRVDPVTGVEEKILHLKKPRVIKNIPLSKMEQEFYKGFKGINAESKWNSKWRKIEEEEKLKAEKKCKAREDRDNMMRHTVVQRMAAEEKKKVDENEKLRKLLLRKPKPREEHFKSL
ncbi:FK506-binding protein 5-like [Helianthus annuus]|uniref:FK506-binding protein 5-like n=1 Tax=Helianthus annuus TaxID=4232 RepID=UPI001652D657|nr:FK506-binding protein 5-like [Helianthus annuus]